MRLIPKQPALCDGGGRCKVRVNGGRVREKRGGRETRKEDRERKRERERNVYFVDSRNTQQSWLLLELKLFMSRSLSTLLVLPSNPN